MKNEKDEVNLQNIAADLLANIGSVLRNASELIRKSTQMQVQNLVETNNNTPVVQRQDRRITNRSSVTHAFGIKNHINKGRDGKNLLLAMIYPLNPQSLEVKATIDWGDGSAPKTGKVSYGEKSFQIFGSHIFPNVGSFPVKINLKHNNQTISLTTTVSVGNENEQFVSNIYKRLTGKLPDEKYISEWNRRLYDEGNPLTIISKIVKSPEVLREFVQSIYQFLIKRNANGDEITKGIALISNGDFIKLKGEILASQDYFKIRGENNNTDFLKSVYLDVFGRKIDNNEMQAQLEILNKNTTREQVVFLLINTPESEIYSLKKFYEQYFKRSLDVNEWNRSFGNGKSTQSTLNIGMLTSNIIPWLLWQEWLSAHPILETDFTNQSAPIDESNPNWGSILVGGKVFLINDEPKYEWIPILPALSDFEQFESSSTTAGFTVGLSGFAVTPERSQADLPFTHPFANDDDFGLPPEEGGPSDGVRHPWGNVGNDFTFGVALDKKYWPLLATSNLDLSGNAPWMKPNDEVTSGLAETPIGFDVPGILHVEEDMGLLPKGYRPDEFDRVAIYGRWIIDAGHDDFGSEIHPPTILAVARPNDTEETISTVIGLPYFVSQIFARDDKGNPLGLRAFLLNQLSQKDADIFGPHFGAAQPKLPSGPLVDAIPNVHPGFGPNGSFVFFYYTLRLPSGRKSSSDKLIVRANFKTRTGVIPYLVPGNDELSVYIITTPDYQPSQTPQKSGWIDISKDDLLSEVSQSQRDAVNQYLNDIINGIRQGRKPDGSGIPSIADWDALANGLQDLINRGVGMPWYAAPSAPSPDELDQNAFDILMDWSGLKEAQRDINDQQAFPLCGSIKLRWVRG